MASPYDQDHDPATTPPWRWPTEATPPAATPAGAASTPLPPVPPPTEPPATPRGAALPPPPSAPPPPGPGWRSPAEVASTPTWPGQPLSPPSTPPLAPPTGPPPVPPAGWATGSPGPAPEPPRSRSRSRGARILFVAALILGLLLGGAAGGLATNAFVSTATEDAVVLPDLPSTTPTAPDATTAQPDTGGSGSTEALSSWDEVTAAVSVGIVNIQSRMSGGIGSGTGMVLTSDGRVLTNNHVVEGASAIVVTVATTGESYRATVVGTDPEEDVAVIQLTGASGMATIPIGDSDTLRVGDPVAAIGNAGGDGGEPDVATGRITALDQQITASDEDGSNVETLEDMIQVAAEVVPGDSGGALADTSGTVVGMNTAANVAGFTGPMRSRSGSSGEGYAIPINKALEIADQLVAGSSSSGAQASSGAYLGVQVLQGVSGGAEVADVLVGSPAEAAGIEAGDTIIAVDDTTISTPDDLVSTISEAEPGDRVTITWLDPSGRTLDTTVTLGAG